MDGLGDGDHLVHVSGWSQTELVEDLLAVEQPVGPVGVHRDAIVLPVERGHLADDWRIVGVQVLCLPHVVHRLDVVAIHVLLELGPAQGLEGVRRDLGCQQTKQDGLQGNATTTGDGVVHDRGIGVLLVVPLKDLIHRLPLATGCPPVVDGKLILDHFGHRGGGHDHLDLFLDNLLDLFLDLDHHGLLDHLLHDLRSRRGPALDRYRDQDQRESEHQY